MGVAEGGYPKGSEQRLLSRGIPREKEAVGRDAFSPQDSGVSYPKKEGDERGLKTGDFAPSETLGLGALFRIFAYALVKEHTDACRQILLPHHSSTS